MSSKKTKQDAYDRTIKRRFQKAKARAARIKRKFTIQLSAFEALISKDECTYCGGELEKTGSSLDRIDSRYGYTEANSVACCWKCNRMKGALTMEEFFKHIKRILKHVNG